MVKCVVAEDEALLRDALIGLLAQVWPELEIVAACEDGGAALEAIAAHQPQVAFLDIRMPGLTGLEVAAALAEASPLTQVVFVTAYDQYAIDAFDKGALDYLLKPVARGRLEATVQRLKARVAAGGADSAALAGLLRQLGHSLPPVSRAPPLVWLTASAGSETRLIMVDDIAYFQSDSKYTV
ncbi:MAG: response regulator, partial [Pseudomonadota bacterium]